MSRGGSTRGTPSKAINWIFFDAVNSTSDARCMQVSGYAAMGILQHHRKSWAEEIEKEFRFRADPLTIVFWMPLQILEPNSLPDDWIRTTELEHVATKRRLITVLNDALCADGNMACVHLIVTAQRLSDDDQLAAKGREKVDILPELPLHGLYHRYDTLLKRIPEFPPHQSTKSKEYHRFQKSRTTAIYDGFYALSYQNEPVHVTIAPPVEIFHPVFGQFLENINNPEFEPDEAVVSEIAKFMTTAAAIHIHEAGRAEALRGHLTSILSPMMQVVMNPRRSADGTILKGVEKSLIPLIIMEIKRALGQGGCDPLTQASYSVLNMWGEFTRTNIRDKCCCPTFVLAGGGPYLCVLGVVWTDRFIVQRLTDIMWVGEATTYEDAHLYRLSRIFTALRDCQQTLHTFYDGIKDRIDLDLIPNKPHPRYFPYPDSFHEFQSRTKTKFKYLDVLESDSTNVTFLAQTTSDDRKLIVKFIDRYGDNAHTCLAAKKMAPGLLFCGLLNGIDDVRVAASAGGITKCSGLYVGPMRMVIMEYIDGNSAQATPEGDWPLDTHEQIEKALQTLHSQGFVFGDLRRPNVMFTPDSKALLIDFDWSGEEGKVRYPKGLSSGVAWHKDARDFQLIKKEHDMAMLDEYFPSQL